MTIKPGAANKKPRPGRLRIVAGKWRSRLLDIADVPGLRPTSERVRETLFNWLAPSIQGARCLDLFAGTGALGFEALSRGATQVVFVENSRRAIEAIENSAKKLGAKEAVVPTRHLPTTDSRRSAGRSTSAAYWHRAAGSISSRTAQSPIPRFLSAGAC